MKDFDLASVIIKACVRSTDKPITVKFRKGYNIEDDFLMIAKEKGFKLIDIMKYNLSSLSHNSKFKFEPIFIFKK